MIEWEKQDKGWYTSGLGGVADEGGSKWYYYPILDTMPAIGPFKTMKAATQEAELLNSRATAAPAA